MSHAATSSADHPHGHGDHADHGTHGTHEEHGHHMIVPRRLLLTVLGILMLFTFITVGAAQLEQFIAHRFDIVIPQWVNVVVALSIAGVKTILVMTIFMQLRWDNPVNTLIMVFTVFTLSFFLGFIMIDLGNRQAIYSFKGQQIVDGGFGNIQASSGAVPAGSSIAMQSRVWALEDLDRLLVKEKLPLPKHLVIFADQEIARRIVKRESIDKMPPALQEFDRTRNDPRYAAILAAYSHGHSADTGPNTAARSRRQSGLTDPEFSVKTQGHGDAGSAPGSSHSAPVQADPAPVAPVAADPVPVAPVPVALAPAAPKAPPGH